MKKIIVFFLIALSFLIAFPAMGAQGSGPPLETTILNGASGQATVKSLGALSNELKVLAVAHVFVAVLLLIIASCLAKLAFLPLGIPISGTIMELKEGPPKKRKPAIDTEKANTGRKKRVPIAGRVG